MFGYVKPVRGELRVREADYYRAAYCGLCRSMRRQGGFLTSFGLSYDLSFLTVIRSGVSGQPAEIEYRRCPVHPLKKRPSFAESEATVYCASAAVILGYRKCLDDICDERGKKKLAAILTRPIFSRGRKRILRRHPELSGLDERIGELLSKLSELETAREASADAPAEIFGRIMGEILSFGTEGGLAVALRSFGRAIGHWLYLVDAADDYEDDVKKGRYNPIALLYPEGFDVPHRKDMRTALISKLMEAEAAFDLIDLGGDRDAYEISRNILYLGLPEAADVALGLSEKKGEKTKGGACRFCFGCASGGAGKKDNY